MMPDLKSESKALISDIQRYCLHDGPGIRTTVFFKGCPLSCLWCSNPETQCMQPELSYFRSKCTNCSTCVSCCPVNAISKVEDGIEINRKICNLCGICSENCLGNALKIIGKWMTVEEVVHELVKDVPFYRRTNGGVTVSGGSPTMQSEFLLQLLKKCKNLGLHTAMETEGCFVWDSVKDIFNYLDLILFDLKIINADAHKKYTGKSNELTLANVKMIDGFTDCELIIRVPLIPEYTFYESNMLDIADVMSGLNRVKEINLLPFHQFGEAKYQRMDVPYKLDKQATMEEKEVKPWVDYFENMGYKVKIGG